MSQTDQDSIQYSLDIDGRGSQFASGRYTFELRVGRRYRNPATDNEFEVKAIDTDDESVACYYHKRSGRRVSASGWGGLYTKQADSLGILAPRGKHDPLVEFEPHDDVDVDDLPARLCDAIEDDE